MMHNREKNISEIFEGIKMASHHKHQFFSKLAGNKSRSGQVLDCRQTISHKGRRRVSHTVHLCG